MCVTAFSSAFAHSNYQGGSNGSSNYGSSTDSSSMQSGQGTYQRGTFREITPNAGPRVAHGADVFITANFIWWKATQDGLRYAADGLAAGQALSPAANPFLGAPKGKNRSVGEDWAPGFKVGLGLNLSHDGWDLYTQYTWLHASNSNSIANANGAVANFAGIGQQGNNPTLIRAISARGSWDLHFNVIDLELGRNFYLSQFLTMRPFIGLKGTWQDQHFKSSYTAAATETFQIDVNGAANINTVGPYRMSMDTDVWGIGVRGGFNLAYYMAKNWSIFGNFAWTSMWSNYHELERRDHLDDPTTGNTKLVVNIGNDSFYTVKYVGEMELGLRWETWFYDDNYHFAIQAGWEQQVWINWGQFVVIEEQQVEHDLALHGLNLKFRFDF
ncbi:MAG: autotransporter outer membrane beta-barrel domain-containing protein [Chlamydiia bacterium]|nr:autotransporter outer membrane beta-barrel domain-containing protein [Chlamydiia bacterium]